MDTPNRRGLIRLKEKVPMAKPPRSWSAADCSISPSENTNYKTWAKPQVRAEFERLKQQFYRAQERSQPAPEGAGVQTSKA